MLPLGFGIASYTVRKNGAFADNPVYDAYMTTFLVFNMIVPVLMANKLWRTTQEHARGTASSMHVRGTLHLLVQTALVWAVTAAAYVVSEWVDAVPVPVTQVVSDTAQHLVVRAVHPRRRRTLIGRLAGPCPCCYHLRRCPTRVSAGRRGTSWQEEGSVCDPPTDLISYVSCRELDFPVPVWIECRQTCMYRRCIDINSDRIMYL
jgi:hypothetical protein